MIASTPSLPPDLTEPPRALVTSGRFDFGSFDAPIEVVNPLDARSRLPRWIRNLRLKEWEAFQIGDDDWFVCGAVYSAKVLALLQVIAVHRQSGVIHRWLKKVPASSVSIAAGLRGTRTHGRSGEFALTIDNRIGDRSDSGMIEIRARHPGSTRVPPLDLHVTGRGGVGTVPHLVICHPFSGNRALYSDKCTMRASGVLGIGTEHIALRPDTGFLLLDDHKGEYPSPMKYDWVTGTAQDDVGRLISFNLTANQIREPEIYNENAVFVVASAANDNQAGTVHRLPPVTFHRPDGVHAPWRITADTGAVDVTFTPTVRSEMHVGPRHLLAEYYGPYGTFSGRIAPAGAEVFIVDGFFGMGEQKRISF